MSGVAMRHGIWGKGRYNPSMLRAASLAALVLASVLTPSLEAQRTSAGFRGFAKAPRQYVHVGQRSFSNGQSYRGGLGVLLSPYFLPNGEPYWSEEPGPESVGTEPTQVVYASPERERLPATAQVIEIPSAADSKQVKPSAPTMFVLIDGERLETQRFMLTVSSLSVNIGRRERVIPLEAVDLDATTAANRERGINLQIPADRNEILLSF
jgi:hypothetical protein